MDYLEGMLLHAWWADTDYEDRKHKGTWLWFSVFTFFFLAAIAFMTNYFGGTTITNRMGLWKTLTLILFFVTPLLCMIYYSMPFMLRVPILALLGLKYISAFFWMIAGFTELFILPDWLTFDRILEWGNETFGTYLDHRAAETGVTGLFVGGGIIILIAVGIGLGFLVLAIFTPMFMLKAFNTLQYLWDNAFIWIERKVRDLIKSYKSKPASEKTVKKPPTPDP